MTYPICGHCLHSKSSHEPHNGHYMYCGVCCSTCELKDFNATLKPTEYLEVVRIGAMKQ
jgi:hypothetical protein